MKSLTALVSALALVLAAGVVQAKDIGPDEALRLRDAGTIKNFEELNAAVLARHPGGRLSDTELELEHGRYVYKMDVLDAQGVEWDVRVDAATGEIVRDRQDH
ncbi:Peptidase propeptide and YPEB domain protein [compost metagenome]